MGHVRLGKLPKTKKWQEVVGLIAAEFLFRLGVGYEFELSKRWILMPEFNVDFVDGEEAYVFGFSIGYGF